MTDNQRIENARAEHEAVGATVARTSRGPVSQAVQSAMKRYLAAEHYRQLAEEGDAADDNDERSGDRP
jgi:hypothetical protein